VIKLLICTREAARVLLQTFKVIDDVVTVFRELPAVAGF